MVREQFLKTIQKFSMVKKGETILAAVSGGLDSTSLLYLLNEIRASWKLRLIILHVNHQLRGKASIRDEMFVKGLGRKFGIPVYAARVSVREKAKDEKISIEEAARMLRYDFFEKMIKAKHGNNGLPQPASNHSRSPLKCDEKTSIKR